MQIRLLTAKKELKYKSAIREKKKTYKLSTYQTYVDNKRNSNIFWDAVRKARHRKQRQQYINIETWKTHFEGILGQEQHTEDHIQMNLKMFPFLN